MGKRIEFNLSNFRAGIHTEPLMAETPGAYLKELKNLIPNAVGQLVPRRGHTIEYSHATKNIEGLAFVQNTNGQGFMLFHAETRLYIVPVIEGEDLGIELEAAAKDLGVSDPGLDRQISAAVINTDTIALTSEGEDAGYWILLGTGSHEEAASGAKAYPISLPRPLTQYTRAEGPPTTDAGYYFDIMDTGLQSGATKSTAANVLVSGTVGASSTQVRLYDDGVGDWNALATPVRAGDLVTNKAGSMRSTLVVGAAFTIPVGGAYIDFGVSSKYELDSDGNSPHILSSDEDFVDGNTYKITTGGFYVAGSSEVGTLPYQSGESILVDRRQDWRQVPVRTGDLVKNETTGKTLTVGDITVDIVAGEWIDFGNALSDGGTFWDAVDGSNVNSYTITAWTDVGVGGVGTALVEDVRDGLNLAVKNVEWVTQIQGGGAVPDTYDGNSVVGEDDVINVQFLQVTVILPDEPDLEKVEVVPRPATDPGSRRSGQESSEVNSLSHTTGTPGAPMLARVNNLTTQPVLTRHTHEKFEVGDIIRFEFEGTASGTGDYLPELHEKTSWGGAWDGVGSEWDNTFREVGGRYGPPKFINNRLFKVIKKDPNTDTDPVISIDVAPDPDVYSVHSSEIPAPTVHHEFQDKDGYAIPAGSSLPPHKVEGTQTFCIGWVDGTSVNASQWPEWDSEWKCNVAIRTMTTLRDETDEPTHRAVDKYEPHPSVADKTRIWVKRTHEFIEDRDLHIVAFNSEFIGGTDSQVRTLDWRETGNVFVSTDPVNEDPTGLNQGPGYYYYAFTYLRKAIGAHEALGAKPMILGAAKSQKWAPGLAERYELPIGKADGPPSPLIKDYRSDTGKKTVISALPGTTVSMSGANFICTWRSDRVSEVLYPSIAAPGQVTNGGEVNDESSTDLYDNDPGMDTTFKNAEIGQIVRNLTDQSEGIITKVGKYDERATRTITCADGLYGGTNNEWQLNNYWEVVPSYSELRLQLVEEQQIDYYSVTPSSAAVNSITAAESGIVTTTLAHGFSDGDVVIFTGLDDMTELNYNSDEWPASPNAAHSPWHGGRTWRVKVLGSTQFNLVGNEHGAAGAATATAVDTSAYAAEGTGGTVEKVGSAYDFNDSASDKQKRNGPADWEKLKDRPVQLRRTWEAADIIGYPAPIDGYVDQIDRVWPRLDPYFRESGMSVWLLHPAHKLYHALVDPTNEDSLFSLMKKTWFWLNNDPGAAVFLGSPQTPGSAGVPETTAAQRNVRAAVSQGQTYQEGLPSHDEVIYPSKVNGTTVEGYVTKRHVLDGAIWDIIDKHNDTYGKDSGLNWAVEKEFGRVAETSRHGPPAGMKTLTWYNDRLWIAGYGAGVRFSDIKDDDPHYFEFPVMNEIHSQNGRIETLAVLSDNVLVMGGPSAIGRLTGRSSFNFDADWFATQSGPISANAWTQSEGGMYYVTAAGVHRFDGTNIQDITGALAQEFRDAPTNGANATIGAIPGKELVVCFGKPGAAPKTFVLDMKRGTWREVDRQAWSFTNVVNGDENRVYYNVRDSAAFTRFVARWRHGFESTAGSQPSVVDETDDTPTTAAIPWSITTQELDWASQGLATQVKRFDWVSLLLKEDTDAITVGVTVDGGTTVEEAHSVKRLSLREFRIPIRQRGRSVVVSIAGAGDVQIEKVGVSAWI